MVVMPTFSCRQPLAHASLLVFRSHAFEVSAHVWISGMSDAKQITRVCLHQVFHHWRDTCSWGSKPCIVVLNLILSLLGDILMS